MATRNPSQFGGKIPAGNRLAWAFKVLVPHERTRMQIILDAEAVAAQNESNKAKATKQPFTRQIMVSTAMVNARIGDGTFPQDTLAILDAGLVDALKRVKAKSIEAYAASLDDFDKVPLELRFTEPQETETPNPKQAAIGQSRLAA